MFFFLSSWNSVPACFCFSGSSSCFEKKLFSELGFWVILGLKLFYLVAWGIFLASNWGTFYYVLKSNVFDISYNFERFSLLFLYRKITPNENFYGWVTTPEYQEYIWKIICSNPQIKDYGKKKKRKRSQRTFSSYSLTIEKKLIE